MNPEERLSEKIAGLGLTLEQAGPDGFVDYDLGDDGEIVLFLGDEERACESLDEAFAVLEEWAEEHGSDPQAPGAIVEFVDEVWSLLEPVEADARLQAFFDVDLPPLLERYGLQELDPDAFDPDLDDETLLCLVEDGKGACWAVFLDENDEVSYDAAAPGLDEEEG
jgi:hypothetical protein